MHFTNAARIIIISAVWTFLSVDCIDVEDDLSISVKEKKALDELKNRVWTILPNDYMKTEIYLINWVRAAELNVNKAEKMIRENLKWREEYKMDQILKEDFKFMEDEFPIDLNGVDYTGKPILAVNVGEWDVRKSHLTGLHEQNYRYSMRALEIASQKVRDAQERGEAVTRFQVIFNMDGFTLVTHGCLQCLPPYLKFIQAFQNYFPNMVDNVIFINAPSTVYTVLHAIRPIASPTLRNSLRIFGTNKAVWRKYLLNIISPDQLLVTMGGTRIENVNRRRRRSIIS